MRPDDKLPASKLDKSVTAGLRHPTKSALDKY